MKKFSFFTSIALSCALFSSYAVADQVVDRSVYMANVPASILVLPPVNESPDTRATNSFWSTVTPPLAEAGYYVFPVTVVDTMLKENGVTNGFDAQNIPLNKLKEIFGADAALYLKVKKYGSKYQIIDTTAEVEVEAKLVSLNTGALLWQGKESSERSNDSDTLTGLLITALIEQISNQVGDAGYDVSKSVSSKLFRVDERNKGLMYGPRALQHSSR